MKKCKVEQELVLYVGRDLPWWKNWLVELHVRRCQQCQKKLAKLNAIRTIFRESFEQQSIKFAHPNIWEGVREKILPMEKLRSFRLTKSARSPLLFRPAIYLGMGLIILLGMLILEKKTRQKLTLKPARQATSFDHPQVQSYPLVEDVRMPNVTVMTFQTDDPKIKIIWFFKKDSKI